MKKTGARRMASTTSDIGDTSSKQQQAQCKENYNKSKRPVSSVCVCVYVCACVRACVWCVCVCVCVCVCQRETKDRADGVREKSAHFPRRDSSLYLWDTCVRACVCVCVMGVVFNGESQKARTIKQVPKAVKN